MFSKNKPSYHLRQKNPNWRATSTNASDPNVRLIKPLPRQPATDIERLAVTALSEGSTTCLSSLVSRVARELYIKEVATGAGVLDIGLCGPNLFVHDVAVELSAGNGILWQIEILHYPILGRQPPDPQR